MRSPDALSPLSDRRFAWYHTGRFISTIGSTMAPIAMTFAVLDLTGSASDLGLVLAARSIPLVAFLLIGGVIADRLDRLSCSCPTCCRPPPRVAYHEHIPNEVMSRVTSYDALGSFVAMPIGNIVFGPLASAFGAREVLVVSGIAYAAICALTLLSRSVRDLPRAEPDGTAASEPPLVLDPDTS